MSLMIQLKLNTAMFAVMVVSTHPAARLSDLREAIGRWGWLRAVYALLMVRLHRHVGLAICRLMARPLRTEAAPSSRPQREYKLLTEAELVRFSRDPELEMTEELVRAAFKRGDICVGALRNGLLMGYSWFAFGTAPDLDGIWVSFPPQARYGYKSFVRPAFRGGGLMTEMSLYSDEICRAQGKTHGIGFIDTHNFASYRAAHRSGARTVGYAGYLNCLWCTLTFRSRGAKRNGFRFYKRPTNT